MNIVDDGLVAGKVEGGCIIKAGGETVAGGLASGGVTAPAAGATSSHLDFLVTLLLHFMGIIV